MNRQQRRKSKSERPKVYTLNEDQIARMKKEAADEAIQTALILMLGLPCLTLQDKFGFTSNDLQIFMDNVMLWYESVQEGEIELSEIMATLEEETGFKVI